MSGHKPFSKLVAKMRPEAHARIAEKTAALRAEMPLHELRAALDLSQKQIADLLKIDQPAVSRLEKRADMLLSTLSRFVAAMGGTLELRADFPNGSVRIVELAGLNATVVRSSSPPVDPAIIGVIANKARDRRKRQSA